MANDQPPLGYDEVPAPAGKGGAPAGYEEVAAPTPSGPGSTPGAQAQWPPLNMDTAKGVGREAALGAASGAGIPETSTPFRTMWEGMSSPPDKASLLKRMMDPTGGAIEQAYGVGKSLVGAGEDIYHGYEQKDPGMMAHGAASGITQALMLKGMKEVKAHEAAAKQATFDALAIDKGKAGAYQSWVVDPLTKLNAAIKQEVGKHVDKVVMADKLDNLVKGAPAGQIDMGPAAQAARAQSGKTFTDPTKAAETIIKKAELEGPMHMGEAKATISQAGALANSLRRGGHNVDASAMDAFYSKARGITQDRANSLGGDMGKSWSHYINEHSAAEGMRSGLMGELLDAPSPAIAMDHLAEAASTKGKGSRATELNDIVTNMKKYDVDPTNFQQAAQKAIDLKKLTTTNSNVFIGKMRAIINHPLTAAPALVAGAYAYDKSGLPGGIAGMVLPLLIAGKVSGIMDAREMRSLLKEMPQASSVLPNMEGKLPDATPPGAAPPASAPAAGGGSPPVPLGQADKIPWPTRQYDTKPAPAQAASPDASNPYIPGPEQMRYMKAIQTKNAAAHKADMMSSGERGGQDWQSANKASKMREWAEKKAKEKKK